MLDQSFSAADANSYSSWDFGLDQQVLLVPDANKGAQIVINSRDAMEHPWHLQYGPFPFCSYPWQSAQTTSSHWFAT